MSPEEWGFLWLNEGFASFFGAFTPSRVYPEQRNMHTYTVSTCQGLFQSDAGTNTRPMSDPVYTPTEISGSFDNIAYGKCIFNLFINNN